MVHGTTGVERANLRLLEATRYAARGSPTNAGRHREQLVSKI
jgi:hypothetical protein